MTDKENLKYELYNFEMAAAKVDISSNEASDLLRNILGLDLESFPDDVVATSIAPHDERTILRFRHELVTSLAAKILSARMIDIKMDRAT